ncbi:MAG TPA: hypothetical protein VM734_14020 [Kofleriaceae bacterium]|nr:hypothetical protein [Kofleriaceae bacterium]
MVRSTLAALALTSLVAACGSGGGTTPGGLRADMDKICNAVSLSGASELEASDRAYVMAQWLGNNITSADGRTFLQDFARLGEDKEARRKLLEGTAAKVGLKGCPLVDEWK